MTYIVPPFSRSAPASVACFHPLTLLSSSVSDFAQGITFDWSALSSEHYMAISLTLSAQIKDCVYLIPYLIYFLDRIYHFLKTSYVLTVYLPYYIH